MSESYPLPLVSLSVSESVSDPELLDPLVLELPLS